MKKQITFFASLVMATVTFAQTSSLIAPLKVINNETIVPQHIVDGGKKGASSNHEKALGSVIWSSDFSDASDWTIGTAGQGTFEIGAGPTGISNWFGTMGSTTAANGYAYFNAIQYILAENADPQDTWIISDTIDFSGNTYVEISFEQRYRHFNSDSVFIDFSSDGGLTWDESVRLNKDAVTNGPTIQDTVKLVFHVNNTTTGNFRFRWFNASTHDTQGSGYAWFIDDVFVRELSDNDLAVTYDDYHIEFYRYSQIPLTQVAPILFRAGVKNQGINTSENVKLVLDINSGAFSEESLVLNVPSMGVDTLDVTYTPSAVGSYTVTQTLVMDSVDDYMANNALPNVNFDVTNNIYAVDRGAPYTDYPLTSLTAGGTPVIIDGVGTSYDIFADQEVHAIDFRLFTGTDIGAEVYGALYEANPSYTQLSEFWTGPLVETDLFTLETNSQISQMHTLQFTSPYMLETGKTYLFLLKIASDTVHIAVGGKTETSQAWLHGNHENVWGTYTDIPVVRANFDGSLSVAQNDVFGKASVFPNPATDKATVSFDLNNASNVTIEVTDITGKVVSEVALTKAVVGTNETEINTADFASGLYSVVIKSSDSSITRKLVVR